MIDIQTLFDSFNGKKIIIIGDVMVDSYLWGKVDRISPEAPIPVVSITKRESRLGGAANVALNLKALGAEPIICSVIGDDSYGQIFTDLLEYRSISSEGIIKSENRKTTRKSRIISNNQQLLRVDEEINDLLSIEIGKGFIDRTIQILNSRKIDAIIFQDYDKGVIFPELIASVVALAKQANIPVLVDPKKRNFLEYHDVTLFKPNLKELSEGLNIPLDKTNVGDIKNAVDQIHLRLNCSMVMITLSEHGIFISEGAVNHQSPAVIRDVADVSGAGDTVISVACLCLCLGVSSREIAIISNIAGGLVCEKVGVVPVDKERLKVECVKFFDIEKQTADK